MHRTVLATILANTTNFITFIIIFTFIIVVRSSHFTGIHVSGYSTYSTICARIYKTRTGIYARRNCYICLGNTDNSPDIGLTTTCTDFHKAHAVGYRTILGVTNNTTDTLAVTRRPDCSRNHHTIINNVRSILCHPTDNGAHRNLTILPS